MVYMRQQVASKIDADDKAKIEESVEEAITWLDANGLAEVLAFLCLTPCVEILLKCSCRHIWLGPCARYLV